MSEADENRSLQEGNVIRDGKRASGNAVAGPVHIGRNALLGTVFVFCLIVSPFCLCSCASIVGADDDPGHSDTLYVWDIGKEYRYRTGISGHTLTESFILERDLKIGAVTVPAGSVPSSVVPADEDWSVAPVADGFNLLYLGVAGHGKQYAVFVAEYQIYGILPQEEAASVLVEWTLVIATVLELKVTAEEIYS